jgi:hypothetical protein
MLSPTQHGGGPQLFDTTPDSCASYRRAPRSRSVHETAKDRLSLELGAREGLVCRFHAGVTWSSIARLLPQGMPVDVQLERVLRLATHWYVPDLTIRCPHTQRILLLIEVWDSHPVGTTKARALGLAQLAWIEVKAPHVLARRRSYPLSVLDWGGPGLPPSPYQGQVFWPGGTASDATPV